MSESPNIPAPLRVIDLFCGCGGLSLGFELFSGSLKYSTVLALDNSAAAIQCFNSNSNRPKNSLPTARLSDVLWFSDPSEVLLYYLVHYCLWEPDADLRRSLNELGLSGFLNNLFVLDQSFESSLEELAAEPVYSSALSKVDPKVFSLAICKALLIKIGVPSLSNPNIAPTAQPWRAEHNLFRPEPKGLGTENAELIVNEIHQSLGSQWDTEVGKLEDASQKEGRGQHAVVAARLQTLVDFLRGDGGKLLRNVWLEWRTRRDSMRANFCTAVRQQLGELYTGKRKIQLILGGPPCKGFSRIGRAVIESLRNQGVHAWTSKEYGDERNALLHKYVLFLEALRPDVFIFENVSNFRSALRTPSGLLDASEVLARSIEELSNGSLHYSIRAEVVKASEYAVPQDRRRYIMVGFDKEKIDDRSCGDFFDLPSYQDEVPLQIALQGLDTPREFDFENPHRFKSNADSKSYTLIDYNMPPAYVTYINWIRQPLPGETTAPAHTDAHLVRKLRGDDLALIEKFAPGQRWMDYKIKRSRTLSELRELLQELLHNASDCTNDAIPKAQVSSLLERIDEGLLLRLLLENVTPELSPDVEHHLLTAGYLTKGDGRHGDWFERLTASETSKTIVAHIGKDTYGYIHPCENRAISIREAARIQSFPDFFKFGSLGVVDAYSVIGNAVPPLLAKTFAAQLAKMDSTIGIFGNDPKRVVSESETQVGQLSLSAF